MIETEHLYNKNIEFENKQNYIIYKTKFSRAKKTKMFLIGTQKIFNNQN